MREYRVSELTGNEILAKPVCLDNGSVILEIGTALKVSYKESLTSLNIQKIYAEDPFEKYEKVNLYFKPDVFLKFENDLKAILSQHIYKEHSGLRKLENLVRELVNVFEMTKEDRALDIKDRTSDMYEHTIYISLLVMLLGKEYGFSRKRMENAVLGCLLHDLGYRYIDINYKGYSWDDLNYSQLHELKKHTVLGYTALENEVWIPEISKLMVLSHHERLDGSGYPLRQKNNQKECRMIQICDAFDCAVSGMESSKKTIIQAFDLISDKEKFESRMEKILERKIGFYPAGTVVKTEEGKKAVVISQTENAQAPVILYTGGMKENHFVTENLNRKKAPKITNII
jgi:HD-GYP domain-containing protein (c-di-GMP phosphodiesterase class II)